MRPTLAYADELSASESPIDAADKAAPLASVYSLVTSYEAQVACDCAHAQHVSGAR